MPRADCVTALIGVRIDRRVCQAKMAARKSAAAGTDREARHRDRRRALRRATRLFHVVLIET